MKNTLVTVALLLWGLVFALLVTERMPAVTRGDEALRLGVLYIAIYPAARRVFFEREWAYWVLLAGMMGSALLLPPLPVAGTPAAAITGGILIVSAAVLIAQALRRRRRA